MSLKLLLRTKMKFNYAVKAELFVAETNPNSRDILVLHIN